jgi:hypothetical protein
MLATVPGIIKVATVLEAIMNKIVLSDEQTKSLTDSNGADVVFVDSSGKSLGWLQRPVFTDEEIAEAERALKDDGPRYTTQQVLAHLRSLAPE